jgi:hypothetical protein
LRPVSWAVTSHPRFQARITTGWWRVAGRLITLRGLVAELKQRGLKVDYRLVWEFVCAEKLSFKKRCTPASRIVRRSPEGAGSRGAIKDVLILLGLSTLIET